MVPLPGYDFMGPLRHPFGLRPEEGVSGCTKVGKMLEGSGVCYATLLRVLDLVSGSGRSISEGSGTVS